jgi:hypothetical protein
MIRHVLAACVLSMPAALSGQAHPLVGSWDVSLPGGMRVMNGETSFTMAKGNLTFTIEGDSMVGLLKMESSTRPPTRLAARLQPGPLTFVQVSRGSVTTNGEPSTRVATTTWNFEADGDALKGSLERNVEGMSLPMGGKQPVTGTRKQSD